MSALRIPPPARPSPLGAGLPGRLPALALAAVLTLPAPAAASGARWLLSAEGGVLSVPGLGPGPLVGAVGTLSVSRQFALEVGLSHSYHPPNPWTRHWTSFRLGIQYRWDLTPLVPTTTVSGQLAGGGPVSPLLAPVFGVGLLLGLGSHWLLGAEARYGLGALLRTPFSQTYVARVGARSSDF